MADEEEKKRQERMKEHERQEKIRKALEEERRRQQLEPQPQRECCELGVCSQPVVYDRWVVQEVNKFLRRRTPH